MNGPPLRAVALMCQKGGVGKTTLSAHLAVEAARSGESALLIDADHPQASATKWGDLRGPEEAPPLVTIEPVEIPEVLRAARAEAITFAIIDTSPHATPSASIAAEAADLILIPCRPSFLDIAAAERSAKIAQAVATKAAREGRRPPRAYFVLNACPAREDSELRDSREVLGEILPVCPIEIGDRKPFKRALAHGVSVSEFDPRGRAAAEITDLFAWIRSTLAEDPAR